MKRAPQCSGRTGTRMAPTRFSPPASLNWTRSVFEYIEAFYDRQRRHSTLNMLSPANYEQLQLSPLGGGDQSLAQQQSTPTNAPPRCHANRGRSTMTCALWDPATSEFGEKRN